MANTTLPVSVSRRSLARQSAAGLRLLSVMTVLLGIGYPLLVWVVAHLPGLADKAEGSVVRVNGQPVGSSLIGIDTGQLPNDPYFHTRPSASASGALGPGDASTSGGGNKSADSPDLVKTIDQRRALIAAREHINPAQVPPDAVTASGSGVDPDISPAYAAVQVARVARVTGLAPARVRDLVAQATAGRSFGLFGEPGVDVTELNAAIAHASVL